VSRQPVAALLARGRFFARLGIGEQEIAGRTTRGKESSPREMRQVLFRRCLILVGDRNCGIGALREALEFA